MPYGISLLMRATRTMRETLSARDGGNILIYAITLMDKPDSGDLRLRVRPEHKAYLAEVSDRMAFAGPLTSDDGKTMIGSLLAIDFDSRAAAHAWLADEPFTKAGLYASTSVHAFVNLWPQKTGFPPAST